MKNFFIVQLLKLIGKKLDGYKTKIGGGASILMGILGIVGLMFPDQKTVDLSLEASLALIVAGFAALGIGGKVQKLLNAMKDESQTDGKAGDQKPTA
jgi:hypothetical protein